MKIFIYNTVKQRLCLSKFLEKIEWLITKEMYSSWITQINIFSKITITKFCFDFKIPKLYLPIIEDRADLMHSLYGAFKKAEIYLDILNTQAQMHKEYEPKSGYKAVKFFQALVIPK